MKIVIASTNQGKIREIKKILAPTGHSFVSLDELEVSIDVVENGLTFEENAQKKAKAVSEETGLPSISDDSGLEVKALAGGPGIHTGRFGGPGLSDQQRYLLLLEKMVHVPAGKREARFVCVIAFYDFENESGESFRGECTGEIVTKPHGSAGFGYDPVFFVPGYGKTFSELDQTIKNRMSHRANALKQVAEFLKKSPISPG
ncbi:MAG: RdgB/HAM1 family non-canonical purine NTP pyrophosphatase [Nitrospinota bacterium]